MPKAFVRSKLWDPDTWPTSGDLPSPAEVSHAHARDPELTVADVERQQQEAFSTGWSSARRPGRLGPRWLPTNQRRSSVR